MDPTALVMQALSSLPGATQGTSKVGNPQHTAWFVGGREFAHLHSDSMLDLRLPLAVQARLRGHALARFRSSRSQWLELTFCSPEEAQFVASVAREAWAAASRAK